MGTSPSQTTVAAPSPTPLGCPLCGDRPVSVADLADVPVLANELWPTPEEALRAPRGTIRLALCHRCGLLWNTAFEPALVDYTQRYENSLHFSPTFQRFAARLAERLTDTYALQGGTILEVGSGKGEFLALLCGISNARGLGLDPSHEDVTPGERIRFVAAEMTDDRLQRADLIVCRHVLEHVPDPVSFLVELRRVAADGGTTLYLEVPNGRYMLEELAVWDLIYEHHTYFTETSLRTALAAGGFTTLRLERSFGGQYLSVDARPRQAHDPDPPDPDPPDGDPTDGNPTDDRPDPASLDALTTRFGVHVRAEVARWRDLIDDLATRGPVAVWGIGSKGVMFLNAVRPPDGTYAVDINPRKHGRFVPGTGQEVMAPDRLRGAGITTVIVMNPRYLDEVRGALSALEEQADVIAV